MLKRVLSQDLVPVDELDDFVRECSGHDGAVVVGAIQQELLHREQKLLQRNFPRCDHARAREVEKQVFFREIALEKRKHPRAISAAEMAVREHFEQSLLQFSILIKRPQVAPRAVYLGMMHTQDVSHIGVLLGHRDLELDLLQVRDRERHKHEDLAV
jgi:hypothetical protein